VSIRTLWRPISALVIVGMWSIAVMVCLGLLVFDTPHAVEIIGFLSSSFITFGLGVVTGVAGRAVEKLKGVQGND